MPVFCLCFTRDARYCTARFCPCMCATVRPSRPSVTFVDQDHIIGCKSWKLIARTTPTPSLFVAQRRSTYFQGNTGKVWGDYRWVTGENGVQKHKSGNISDKLRVKIEEKLLPIGTHQRFFERFHPRPSTTFSSWRLYFETATTPINHY